MKYSKQRELLLKILKENKIHPNADKVYELLKKELPNISLGTVYRNLNMLVESGIIKKVEGLDGSSHFDYETIEHHHFICKHCGKVYDVPIQVFSSMEEKIKNSMGFVVEDCEVSFKGICKNCRK